jgi:formylglycine-generating enzyme required for sulfatase activity
VRDSSLAGGESVLLVVDQFEELFRFARERKNEDGGAEARLFVASLLEATDASTAPLYVVLTMRSDFLGECSQFAGLPDALNRSQYLIPQLTREQVRDSIEKPARLVSAEMNKRLVERLLNELGDDTSELPVLQHALNRTYMEFLKGGGSGEIQVKHYLDAGTMAGALDKHAGDVLEGLSEPAQPWTEIVFRALTAEEGNRKIRRPVRLGRLYGVAGASDVREQTLIREVIDAYAERHNSLLVHSDDSVIDVSHESLIGHWSKLKLWADEEAKAASWYQRAADDTVRYRAGEARTWRDPELSLVLKNILSGAWNQVWADRLPNAKALYPDVKSFLKLGDAEQRQERGDQETRDAQKLADANALAAAERKSKEDAQARAEAERKAKEDAESRAGAESKAKEEAEARANAEEQAKNAAQALVKAQRRANVVLRFAGVSVVSLVVLLLWSQIRVNQLLKSQSNVLLAGQGALQAKLGAAAEARVDPNGLRYVFIPSGNFMMGCSFVDFQCDENEKPAHAVHITKGFWLGQTEVTQAAWKKVMNTDPSHFKGEQLPVETVSWDDAAKYCETTGGRLPTEAEWEYAARAGSNSARYGELDAIAWYFENSGKTTHEVGRKKPNQFGLFDMLGNAWEWVEDDYAPYTSTAETDPLVQVHSQSRTHKVVRGGSWNADSQLTRASGRIWREPYDLSELVIGFRCVGEFR